jgi:hypothetical protein
MKYSEQKHELNVSLNNWSRLMAKMEVEPGLDKSWISEEKNIWSRIYFMHSHAYTSVQMHVYINK